MEYQVWEAEYSGKLFRIEESFPGIGAYIFIFENGNSVSTYDYLQDDIEMCKKFALSHFQLPLDEWLFKGYKK